MNEMEWAPISGQCLIYVLCGIVEVEAYDSLLVCPSGSSHSMMMVMGLKANVIAMWQCSLSSQWNMMSHGAAELQPRTAQLIAVFVLVPNLILFRVHSQPPSPGTCTIERFLGSSSPLRTS